MESPITPDKIPILPPNNITAGAFTAAEVKLLPQMNLATYLKLVEPLGQEIEAKTGILRWVPMVQSAHESASGNSGLARNHCNLFGIVATDSWRKSGGAIAALPTWEEIKGKRVDMTREFRQYNTWRDSFFDWSRLITTLGVYKKAFELLKDPATVPAGIEAMAAVYATDSKYARKLLDIYHQVVP